MKIRLTSWSRLSIGLAFLILLLLVGFGLALWVEEARMAGDKRNVERDRECARIAYALSQKSEAMLASLLEPRGEGERTNRLADPTREADLQLGGALDHFASAPAYSAAMRDLRDYTNKWMRFQQEVQDVGLTNREDAIRKFRSNSGLRDQRLGIVKNLFEQTTQLNQSESDTQGTHSKWGIAAIGAVLLLSAAAARRQSAAVTEPLAKLVGSLERMRRGDFTERLAMKSKDEFGVLSNNLNLLADDLSGLVGQVQNSGIQVNTAATEIGATAREQQSTANEIAATTAQIGATSKEISATSKELVKTMNEVNEVAEQTAKLAGSGQSGIGRMEATMRTIIDAAGSINSKLAVLNEKTTNINSVVTTITKVADQTNLLSLNAAIEAEKAGEYGLGFAVVAVEIRRLADQTAVATYDIEKMVKEMQSAVAAGVMGMDKFSEEVRRGVEEIRQVSTQLAQIILQVQTLTPRFQTVNEGMHAQATGAQQISETLTLLSDSAQQTAESLRQFNITVERLNEAARGLQAGVARFKLGTT